MDGNVVLNAKQVEALTTVPAPTLHEWAARRDAGLPAPGPVHLRLSPRHRRWRLADVQAYLAESRVDRDV
ncbi:helix-turn-helix domain-containing protein [Gordonia sp. i37]|nr:helix-turn-helix domain-containing protein [Gordonia sp. i37]